MTTMLRYNALPVPATADLSGAASRFKIINLAGTICAAGDVSAAGILHNTPKTNDTAEAIYNGLAKAISGGTVSTAGWPLKVANSGFVVAAASGDSPIYGSFIDSCASGDLVRVYVDFFNNGYWRG